ncbi:MAG: A24 family peptidase [Candidatus Bathyarchaeia archaeon]
MEPMQFLDLTRFFFTLAILSYGAVSDFKKREVANELWMIGLPAGLFLTALRLALKFEVGTLLIFATSALCSFLLGLVLFYLGFAGGADAKALFFLGLSLPLYPEEAFKPLSPVLPIFPLTVFNNAILLSLCVPGMIALRNLSQALKGSKVLGEVKAGTLGKLFLLFSSYRVSIADLRKKRYLNPAEKPLKDECVIVRKPIYFMPAENDREKLIEEIEIYASKGFYDDGILASPTLPMVLFLALGLVLGIFGDLALFIALRIVAP